MQRTTWQPICGFLSSVSVALFALLYVVAAARFPGAGSGPRRHTGFSFQHTYWSDLLSETINGALNPASPIARAAMVVVCAGLLVLWLGLSTIQPGARVRNGLVRISGVGCAIAAPLSATTFHDRAVHVASLLGLVAYLLALTLAWRKADSVFRTLAIISVALVTVSYGVWTTRVGVGYLPIVQKFAFVAFLAWMLSASWMMYRIGSTNRSPADSSQ